MHACVHGLSSVIVLHSSSPGVSTSLNTLLALYRHQSSMKVGTLASVKSAARARRTPPTRIQVQGAMELLRRPPLLRYQPHFWDVRCMKWSLCRTCLPWTSRHSRRLMTTSDTRAWPACLRFYCCLCMHSHNLHVCCCCVSRLPTFDGGDFLP